MVDMKTGVFLCQECFLNYQNDPNGPNVDTYTLRLVDNADDLRLAVDNIRRGKFQENWRKYYPINDVNQRWPDLPFACSVFQ